MDAEHPHGVFRQPLSPLLGGASGINLLIVLAVAQLECDLIRERVSAGIRNSRASGKQLERPRRIVSDHEVLRLLSEGASLRQIAEKLGIGYGTNRLRLANH